MLYDVIRIDNEGCAQSDPFGAFAYSKLVDQCSGGITELIMFQAVKVGIFTSPCQFDVFVINRSTQNDGISFGKFFGQCVEACNFSRAYEQIGRASCREI